MKTSSKFVVAAAFALCLGPAAALAGSNTGTLSVSATASSNCTALSPAAISFGSYDPFSYPSGTPLKDSTAATFSTNCTNGAPINWTVGIGSNCGLGSVSADRAMTDGASHYLSYGLYQDNMGNTPWAYGSSCGSPTPVNQTGGGENTANSISIYGEIPGGQDVYTGASTTSYSDSVTVTVNY
jgi:spore coat protein U-like protein